MIVFNKQKGFTIVELLVVVSIMAILGVIFTNILVDTLRGRNKVKAINQVKQNGQVVLDKLSNEIRNADGIVCALNNSIVITSGGTYTLFRFTPKTPLEAPIINGKIQKTNFVANDFAGTPDSSLCTMVSINNGSNLVQSITDTDNKNGVSIDLTPGQPIFERKGDNIMIRFNALAGVLAGYAYDVTVADGGIPFSTSVQVRGQRK